MTEIDEIEQEKLDWMPVSIADLQILDSIFENFLLLAEKLKSAIKGKKAKETYSMIIPEIAEQLSVLRDKLYVDM